MWLNIWDDPGLYSAMQAAYEFDPSQSYKSTHCVQSTCENILGLQAEDYKVDVHYDHEADYYV